MPSRPDITLFTFGPFFEAPDSSPFVVKTMLLLKLAGLAYREDRTGFTMAPKGLLPYIRDGRTTVADSGFIRLHIEKTYGFDFDAGLTAEQKAMACAIERLCEDHLYWAMLHLRWTGRANFRKGIARMFAMFPAPLRPVIRGVMRRRTLAKIKAQGMGRHTPAEIAALALRDLDALEALLGDKPYMMGSTPSGVDATAFAFVAALMTPQLSSPIVASAMARRTLAAYVDRIAQRYFAKS